MPTAPARVALVTGAARGLGLEIVRALAARGHRVYLSARSLAKAEAATRPLRDTGLHVAPLALDVTDAASIAEAAARVGGETGALHVLVNNAGVLLDEPNTALDVPIPVVRATFEADCFGPWAVIQAFAPLLRRARGARVVNVSSTAGSLSELAAGVHEDAWGPPAYCASKAALNALTILAARAFGKDRVLVNACCPGWLRTDMGGPAATLSAAEGADTPVWLATLPDDGPTGGFFAGREPTPW